MGAMTFPRAVGAGRAPLRDVAFRSCRAQSFTCDSQLFRLVPSLVRPQLPFLQSSSRSAKQNVTFPTQLSRFLSTERKARWKKQMRWQIRFQLYLWPLVALGVLAANGIYQARLERKYPTPKDWGLWERWALRMAAAREVDPFFRARGRSVNWDKVGGCYRYLFDRLEKTAHDGKDGGSLEDESILVEGVGKTGLDMSIKPEPWRRAYHQALMGAARAAENLDGYVRDKTRDLVFPKEMMIGPSNPRPRPQRPGGRDPPKEENCEEAYAHPQVFYMKLLTTNGFNSKQRLDAALAYADWLDFKGLHETAEQMYQWGIDIAAAGLPSISTAEKALKSGIIELPEDVKASDNLLRACTAMGVHKAANENVQAALPIFLSVLKSRRSSETELDLNGQPGGKRKPKEEGELMRLFHLARDFFGDDSYPPEPPSGNEVAVRTLENTCEETGLMVYIGEILFAGSSKEKGLAWTRDAVDSSEAVIWQMKDEDQEEGVEKCQQCLRTGLANWRSMAREMSDHEMRQRDLEGQNKWFNTSQKRATQQTRQWQEEETQIELRLQKTLPLITPADSV